MGKSKLKKLNRKGFTLIELLAVIVILAILILLAMPSVLRIMENARQNAFETEVRSYLKAAQTKYAEKAVGSNAAAEMVFNNTEGTKDNAKCDTSTPCPVDMEDKDGYTYSITLKMDNGTLFYNYTIANTSYEAKSADQCKSGDKCISGSTDFVDFNHDVSVKAKSSGE